MAAKILSVWMIDFSGNPVRAGEFAIDGGRTFFHYSQEYLASPDAVALDPVNLPLRPGIFRGRGLEKPFLVFDDALPDAWGMAILEKRCRKQFMHTREMALEHIDTSGVGSLFFSQAGESLGEPHWVPLSVLEECMEESAAFEMRDAEAVFRYLAVSGTSAGGARPKASFVDDNGVVWLVKFPSRLDPDRRVNALVEYEGIRFATSMGLPVPEARIIQRGDTASLALRRFDVVDQDTMPFMGRRGLISFRTLAGGMEQAQLGYEAIGVYLRRISSEPVLDMLLFFRHLLVNCLMVNTDDHLKNFSIVRDQGNGWRFSPAYDLVGNLWGMDSHTMPISGRLTDFSMQDLKRAGRKLGVPAARVEDEIERALVLSNTYLENISTISGTGQLCAAVKNRLGRIKNGASAS